MDQMQCITTFVQVVEQRGFARAARRLNISNAAVTRHVAALEDMLGSRLFDRTTRKLRLTEVGHACFERYARLLTELDEVRQLAQAGSVEPQGVLRVSSTVPFWMWRIAPVLPEFLHRYPKVSIQSNISERIPDILEEGFDLALQIALPKQQSLVAQRILHLRRIVYASPAYLRQHGTPRTPMELTSHNCLLYAHYAEKVDWRFHRNTQVETVTVEGNLRSTDANTLRLAAMAGLGIARSPAFLLEKDLAAGRLVQVLPDYESEDPDLWAVYPSRRQLPAKVRVFIEFLQARFGNEDYGRW